MSVNLTERQFGDVTVIDCVGRITLGKGAISLRDKIRKLSSEGRTKVILHLADTTDIDASGIGEIYSGFTDLKDQGASLKLLAPSKRIVDLLQITQFITFFDIFDDEAMAVESFK